MLSVLLLVLAQSKHPCQPCHAQIVASYQKTAMARSSAADSPRLKAAAAFLEPVTQTTVAVSPTLELRFNKEGQFDGSRQLKWVIGSGRVGHSLLFQQGNRLFQSPVSFYSQSGQWQLSPGFERRPQWDLTRAVEPSCLNCHTTRFNPASLQLTPGIDCERCHGDGRPHIASSGKAKIIHPGKLPPHERDSICAQCHLTGVARVARLRPNQDSYLPGRKLSDYSAIFVEPPSSPEAAIGVTSHFEKLALSKCTISTGESFTCTTCHDPHSEPNDAAAWFNAKCQSCHAQKPCRQSAQTDCIHCHMPKGAGRGVDHSSYTDHSIPRDGVSRKPANPTFASFFPNAANPRDTGLALAILNRLSQAQPLLEKAVQTNPTDLAALSQLAQIHDRQGREAEAQPLYEAILRLDPSHPTAATNLAVIHIKAGRAEQAIQLWRVALRSNPAQTGVRMNLAQALFRLGRKQEAAQEIEQALIYDPDQPAARRLLRSLRPGN